MIVKKILSNNALIASDSDIECVYVANGVGFKNKVGEEYVSVEYQKKYDLLKDTNKHIQANELDPIYIDISANIVSLAQDKFDKIETNIVMVLADHIAFAIERINKKMDISNPFTKQIKLLFPEEFKVALKGKDLILNRLNIEINEDEVSYIALHIHNAISSHEVTMSLTIASTTLDFIKKLNKELNISIDEDSLAYARFSTHIRFMIARYYRNENLDIDMNAYTKKEFLFSYNQAELFLNDIENALNIKFKSVETGYLALHIERIIMTTLNKEEDK